MVFQINNEAIKTKLFSLPTQPEQAISMFFPTPGGELRLFKVWMDNMMEDALAAKYPNIKTFTGYAADNKNVTVKLDYTEYGFHAMVFDNAGTYFIDPYSNANDGFYCCYYKKDYQQPLGQMMFCETDERSMMHELTNNPPIKLRINGAVKRTFRLALACTGEYAIAVAGPSPTKVAVLSKMITSMNRVNGVFERELAVHMTLIGNNDTLIFLNPSTDPYSNNSSSSSMLSENVGVINSRIGIANYDIGHVFSTGAGGQAQLASVCKSNAKAQGVTGRSNPQGDPFDIDFVAHEMGHQFGAEHTFNANTGSCGGNGDMPAAYEPGSGSTIMSYAGLCNASNNLQSGSDDYFHAISLVQITDFLTAPNGATCASVTATINTPPQMGAFTQTYHIPKLTPFELTAPPVIDSDHDTITYCWEQWNKGNFGTSWSAPSTHGPIFRSFHSDTSSTRVFPRLDTLINGTTSYVGEKLPDVDRFLTFKLTVRDIYNGIGAFNFPDDSVHLDVTANAGPFTVTSPSTSVNWLGSTFETVTWNVANTNLPPVNCANVDILLSVDGGYTYPHVLIKNTPNDGSETITVPNISTTTKARVKVKSAGNVFFNINPANFILTQNTGVKNVSWQNGLNVFPVPANEMLHLMSSTNTQLDIYVVNTFGQNIFTGRLAKKLDIDVKTWAKGVYYLQFINEESGEKIIRPILID